MDLGEGTSKLVTTVKPLSIQDLLSAPVNFVEQQHKRRSADEIPYEPINQKVGPRWRMTYS